MMREFKFLSNKPIRPFLENEQEIRYWHDHYMSLSSRVIAWSRDIHFNSDWRRVIYHGTMEVFFANRLHIPVIGSIYMPDFANGAGVHGRLISEYNKEFLTDNWVGLNSLEITYYEII